MLIGASHGILLGFTLLSVRRGNRLANRILALALICFACGMAAHTLGHSKYILRVPHLAKTELPLLFLIGPLFYFYVRALTGRQFKLHEKLWLHALPAGLCLISLLPFYLLSASEKIRHLEVEHQQPCAHCLIITWLFIIQLFAYLIAAIRMVVVHFAGIKQSHSSIEKINLRWLQYLLSVFVIVWMVTLVIQLSAATPQAFNYAWLLVAVVMFLIGYMGLRQPEIFAGEENLTSVSDIFPKKKYEKSTLTTEKARDYLARLQKLMATEKPFLDKDLTLNSLAEKLALPSHHLSQIINERLQQNFFEFVNSYRVEEAKRLLTDPANKHLNLSEIGLEAGFNSVSSFNSVFKKFAQITPSRYQKQFTRQDTPARA